MSEDTNVIKGLQVTVPGEKVRAIWEQKAKHHDGRKEHYRDQLRALRKAEETVEDEGGTSDDDEEELTSKFSNSSYQNKTPEQSLRESIKRHVNDAREARFWAENTDTSKTYLLSKDDLHRLGVLRERY